MSANTSLKPPAPIRSRGFRRMLSGCQNHRCAFCGIRMTLLQGFNNSAVPVKIDKKKHRTFDNCVSGCKVCNGYCANYENVFDYFEKVQREGRPDAMATQRKRSAYPAQVRKEHPEKVAYYQKLMSEGLGHPCRTVLRGIEGLSFEQIAEVVAKNVGRTLEARKQQLGSQGNRRRNGVRPAWRYRANAKHRPMTPPKPGFIVFSTVAEIRVYLSGCQNHKCCYCHGEVEEMGISLNVNVYRGGYKDRAHAATIEHYIDVQHGGSDSLSNLIVACLACNNLRQTLKMTAEEFDAYVQSGALGTSAQMRAEFNRRARANYKTRAGNARGHLYHYA